MTITFNPVRQLTALGLGLASLLVLGWEAHGETACTDRYSKLRFNDQICVRAPGEGSVFDRLKHIPLAEDIELSLGGEVRQRYEFTNNPAYGGDPQDESGVWMQRLTLHGDLRLGDHVRHFGQAFHAVAAGRAGGPSPVDENLFEFQNAFVDLSAPIGIGDLTARFGRQELELGSGRLVSVREGPNNRRNFDGVRLILQTPDWELGAQALRPVQQNRGVLDDQTNDQVWLWGLSASGGRSILPVGALDLTYLGFRDEAARFVQGTAIEERHSFGLRFFGAQDGWDWNWEGVVQAGSFGGGDIRAWTLATDTGFTFGVPWRPRFGISMNVASGDNDPTDGDLGTFNPLFPRGNYFSEAAVLGPRNFFNVNPSLEVSPAPNLTAAFGSNFFWRLNTGDGVYTPSGQILRAPGGSDERFVGTGLSLSASYEIANGLEATAIYSRLFAGSFLRQTGPGEDIDFFEATVQFKF